MDKVKEHFKRNQDRYICFGVGVGFVGITALIMRSRSDFSIKRDHVVLAKRDHVVPGETSVNALEVNRGGLVLGNSYALNNVSFISSNRKGPPSWVVRCKETGNIFMSQVKAATEMGLSKEHLSTHLNGMRDNVNGYTFERICLAA